MDISVENPDELPQDLVDAAVEWVRPSLTQYESAALEDWVVATQSGAGSYFPSMAAGVDGWAQYNPSSINPDVSQRNYLFERNEWRNPPHILAEFKLANQLVMRDDVVSGICEITENLAVQRMKWESEDMDEEDIWNQISSDIDLDSRVREMWRELFTYSQFYVAMFWGKKTYTIRGRNHKSGVKRKKQYRLNTPISISLLDPTKVIPVGSIMFEQEKLVWAGTPGELEMYDKGTDRILNQLFTGHYEPSKQETQQLSAMGIDTEHLMLLNPENVWRHTLPRPAYKRWADVRLKSVFPLMDLKQNLRAMDRAHLVGATNFILLVRKGTDKIPARQQELDNLDRRVRTLARVPVLVGDHRLSVEIVQPDKNFILDDSKWDTVDHRIGARLLQSLAIGGDQGRRDDSLTIGRAVARGIEGRRHQLSRAIEKRIAQAIIERNPDTFDAEPSHCFVPKHVALDWDTNFVNMLLQMRDRGDISRETFLEEADFDQVVEFRNREYEDENFDKVFLKPTLVPFSGNGAQGGAGGTAAQPAAGAKTPLPKKPAAPRKSQGGADNKRGAAPPGRPSGSKTSSTTPKGGKS
jgi:hypothetical protein